MALAGLSSWPSDRLVAKTLSATISTESVSKAIVFAIPGRTFKILAYVDSVLVQRENGEAAFSVSVDSAPSGGDFQGIRFFDPTVSMTIYLLERWSKGVSAICYRTSSIRLAGPSRSGRASSRSFHCYR